MHGSPKPPPRRGSSMSDETRRPADWSLPLGGRLVGAVEQAGAALVEGARGSRAYGQRLGDCAALPRSLLGAVQHDEQRARRSLAGVADRVRLVDRVTCRLAMPKLGAL